MYNKWRDEGLGAGPLIIAHRGASAAAPQNTLAAFEKAIALGADGVELDVHLSSDGIPVVIHDFNVDATTNGHGAVTEMTLDELKLLDAGSSFSPEFASERIPTLAEVLTCLRPHDALLNVEVKSTSLRNTGLEDAIITLIREHRVAECVIFSSFNPVTLWRLKRLAPDVPAGLLYSMDLSLPLRQAWFAPLFKHEARHPHHSMVNAAYMEWAHRRGYMVNTWTVDHPVEMQRLITLGVDSIITNVPDVLRHLLEPAVRRTAP
ncbi:MAG: glycerophosphodiester phosphodiesterase [Anaerolineae bacterium]|nr:glycerophosphodiester phosphodiesterase [Anaerolineae bacterium]